MRTAFTIILFIGYLGFVLWVFLRWKKTLVSRETMFETENIAYSKGWDIAEKIAYYGSCALMVFIWIKGVEWAWVFTIVLPPVAARGIIEIRKWSARKQEWGNKKK